MSHPTNTTREGREEAALCEECPAGEAGGVTLRICLSCGHVGCADGSSADHAAAHYAETDHPVAALVGSEPVSRWSYPEGREE